MLAAKFSFKKIFTLETSQIRRKALECFINENNLEKKITVINKGMYELDKNDLNNMEVIFVIFLCYSKTFIFVHLTKVLHQTQLKNER